MHVLSLQMVYIRIIYHYLKALSAMKQEAVLYWSDNTPTTTYSPHLLYSISLNKHPYPMNITACPWLHGLKRKSQSLPHTVGSLVNNDHGESHLIQQLNPARRNGELLKMALGLDGVSFLG